MLVSRCLGILALVLVGASALIDRDEPINQKEFRSPDLDVSEILRTVNDLPPQASSQAVQALNILEAKSGRVDARGGRLAVVLSANPMVPGKGVGNTLTWPPGRQPGDDAELGQEAWISFSDFLKQRENGLNIDVTEVSTPKITVHGGGVLVQIFAQRVKNGLRVVDSFLSCTIDNGNLVLYGIKKWGDINISTVPQLSDSRALDAVKTYLGGDFTVVDSMERSELAIVPMASGGNDYKYTLVWLIPIEIQGDDLGNFQATVDAETGGVLAFEDQNHYIETPRKVKGGVYPLSNDGQDPDGVIKPEWPMPFDRVTIPGGAIVVTDSGGNLPAPVDGSITSNLNGQYAYIEEDCGTGTISLSSESDIDFSFSAGTDCQTPGVGGDGNTHAARSVYYELNRIQEMGRGQLPNNSWLQQPLRAITNDDRTCNAQFGGNDDGGFVRFFRRGTSGCANTGELAAVVGHEWGHGMDYFDATPRISNPSGEGIADLYAAIRLNDSCIGRGFKLNGNNCGGFGDPCLSCSGVRDIDYEKHQSGTPRTWSWANQTCTNVHCRGVVYSGPIWSLWKRYLQQAPYGYDDNTAHEIVTRLTFVGAGAVSEWYSPLDSDTAPFSGCGLNSGYLSFLAADDDDGDLTNGTPHMNAIFDAFNEAEIACATPIVQDSGCMGTPTTQPILSATALNKAVQLTWDAVNGATEYEIFRTDGVQGCGMGKAKVGVTTGTTFTDTGLLNGRDYYHIVIPKGNHPSCFGLSSVCVLTTPADVGTPTTAPPTQSTTNAPTDAPTPAPTNPPQCTLGQFGDSCAADSDCCSNKCRGPRSSRTCKNQ